jgi:cation diffusion facilitator CzcD-associated flavoprotein CzcO
VTLVPALAAQAARVTMVQRSPTYVLSLPSRDPLMERMKEWLPERVAYFALRWRNILFAMGLYAYCRQFPEPARRWLIGRAERALAGKVPVEPHFAPKYPPWDQRLCLVPDDDLFVALREGRAAIVTGEIERFTERGLRMKSGEEIEADLIVTATGLSLKVVGGASISLDGQALALGRAFVYRGCMICDVPNLAFTVGYTNASWTLKVDLATDYFCRLIKRVEDEGKRSVVSRLDETGMAARPVVDLQAGYILRAAAELPVQGTRPPWRLYQNYLLDNLMLRYGGIEDEVLEMR